MSDSNNDLMFEDSSITSADHSEDHSEGHSTDTDNTFPTSDSSLLSASQCIDSVTDYIYVQKLDLERLIDSDESDITFSSSFLHFSRSSHKLNYRRLVIPNYISSKVH